MQGNSLIEEFHGISLDIEKKNEQQGLFSGGSDLDTLIDDLHQKQDDFFNAEHPREKKQKRDAVETAIYNIFHNELEKKKNISPQEAKDIEADLKEMTHGNRERNFFPWKLYFADVFREKGGFDVVIGNPPYGNIFKDKSMFNKVVKKYAVAEYKIESYAVFTELATMITNNYGSTSFIIPYTFLSGIYFSKFRHFLVSLNLQTLIVLGKKIFDTVEVDTCIFLLTKGKNKKFLKIADFRIENLFKNDKHFATKLIKKELIFQDYKRVFSVGSSESLKLFKKLRSLPKKGEDYLSFYHGIQSHGNKIAITQEQVKNSYPLLKGRDFSKYCVTPSDNYFVFIKENIKSGGDLKYHLNSQKIIVRTTADSIIATIDTNKHLVLNSVNIAVIKDFSNPIINILLGIYNSKIIDFWYKISVQEPGKTFAEVKIVYLKRVPLPEFSKFDMNIINYIDEKVSSTLSTKKTNPQADTTALEAEIDQLVYELYGLTEEEIAIVEESVV